MNKQEMLRNLFIENNLIKDEDTYEHKFYTIITRPGIEKIQANNNISITYEAVEMQPGFAVVKATATKGDVKIETFGSALHGAKGSGNTTTHYVAEMAEKRAMSRAVLKVAGFYEHGCFGEEEAEEFKEAKPTYSQSVSNRVNRMKEELDHAHTNGNWDEANRLFDEADDAGLTQVCDYHNNLVARAEKEGM